MAFRSHLAPAEDNTSLCSTIVSPDRRSMCLAMLMSEMSLPGSSFLSRFLAWFSSRMYSSIDCDVRRRVCSKRRKATSA
eukprot:13581200-Heterocapsa_arctica.AAC.1